MNALINISQWMTALPDRNFSSNLDAVKTLADFRCDVRQQINLIANLQGDRWAVYHSDSYQFLVILCALWQLGKTACIPGDNCMGTIERLKSRVSGFLGEFANHSEVIQVRDLASIPSFQWNVIDRNFEALEIYTSGSTGEPKPISKTIAQLEDEVATLAEQWPSDQQSCVLATVSHQHMYGMVFKLFWPVSTQRIFISKTCEYIEDILYQGSLYPRFCLISSPSHLGRMERLKQWDTLSTVCDYVVSSAAPLNKHDSILVSQLLKADVREIYGSSETGAVAWRIQSKNDDQELWRALPNVQFNLTKSGALNCAAPYLGEIDHYELPDKAEFIGDGFSLLGRTDRIVKVEGKRVSLIAMETRLKELPAVKNCKIITLQRKRVETAAVIQLTEAALQQLSLSGRKPLIEQLRHSLKDYFETVVLPRRWRFVEELPYNPQGKLPLSVLTNMFDQKKVEWPNIKEQTIEGSSLTMLCQIPAELCYFDGHFDKNPILPGIVQAHWAQAYARQFLAVEGQFIRLEKIKFQLVIVPLSQVELVLNYDREKNRLQFIYRSEKGVHSSGYICFSS